VDAFHAASLVWTKLLEQQTKNANYVRGLAVAHFQNGEAIEKFGDNLAAASAEFRIAKERLLELQSYASLNFADLNLLATATWNEARITMRYDWKTGRSLFDDAVSLGQECEEKSNGSLKSVGFLTDIQWTCIESMPLSVEPDERLQLAEQFRSHLVRDEMQNMTTYEDAGKLGACQVIIAKTRKTSLQEVGERLTKACHNLTLALEDKPPSPDKWLIWRATALLELGDLNLPSLPKTQKEYYKAAYTDAQDVLDTKPQVKEALNLVYFARDRLQAIANEEAAAIPAKSTN
jgi:hypothetical protein